MSSQPVLAQHSGTCRPCHGRIFKGEAIVRVNPDSKSMYAGEWVHAECIPADCEPQHPIEALRESLVAVGLDAADLTDEDAALAGQQLYAISGDLAKAVGAVLANPPASVGDLLRRLADFTDICDTIPEADRSEPDPDAKWWSR